MILSGFTVQLVNCITSFFWRELNPSSHFKYGPHVQMITGMWQLHSLGEAKQNGILLIKSLPSGGRRKKGGKEKD